MALLAVAVAALPAAVGFELLPLQQAFAPAKALWANWTPAVDVAQIPAFAIQAQALRPRGNASAMLVSAPARLSEMNDVLYTAEASVAGSRIRVVVDTGSSDIWLKTSALKPVLQHREAALGYLKRNQEGKILVPEIILKFGMGTVLGVPLSVKEFCVAGSCVKHQGLVLGLKITDILDLASFDGLLGLALPRDSQDPFATTFLSRLQMKDRDVAFSLLLGGERPFFALGKRKELLKGQHHRLPVYGMQAGLTMWTVQMNLNVTESGSGKHLLDAKGYSALDSGSTLLVMPSQLYVQVTTHLLDDPSMCFATSGQTICFCEAGLNDLSLIFDDLVVKLTQEDLLTPVTETICRLNIMPMPPAVQGLPVLILGQVFLRKVYAVFDPGDLTSSGSHGPAVWLADQADPEIRKLQQAAVKHPPSDLAAVPGDSTGPLLLALLALAVAATAGTMAWRRKPVVKEDAYMAL